MTLFLLFFILVVLLYLYYNTLKNPAKVVVINNTLVQKDLGGIFEQPQNNSLLMQPAMPSVGIPSVGIPAVGIPVNVESRGPSPSYTQVGILTRGSGGDLILPLMGRRLSSGRDKMQ
jgi:hypothetical protein